jgi:hypothetical protein
MVVVDLLRLGSSSTGGLKPSGDGSGSRLPKLKEPGASTGRKLRRFEALDVSGTRRLDEEPASPPEIGGGFDGRNASRDTPCSFGDGGSVAIRLDRAPRAPDVENLMSICGDLSLLLRLDTDSEDLT